MSESTVLVLGGAGFIGTNVSASELSNGASVKVFDNLSRPGVEHNWRWLDSQFPGRVELLKADIRDKVALREALQGVSRVYHLAGQTAVTTSLEDPVDDFTVNAQGTLMLLEELRRLSSPPSLLFTSTNKVYGDLADIEMRKSIERYEPADDRIRHCGVSESRSLDFHSPYGCSKGCADQYVLDYARSFGLPTVVFRMSCIYGPHQFGTEDQGWVAHFLIQALREQAITIYGDGMQVRDVLYIDDLVRAMALAHERIGQTAGRAFNIGGGPKNTLSLLELLNLIEMICTEKPATSFSEWRTGDQKYYVSDFARFQSATGWAPQVSAREGVCRLASWLVDESPIISKSDTAGKVSVR